MMILTAEQLIAARAIAERAGANRQTLVSFDEEIRRARARETREACVAKFKTLIAEIEAGTLEPIEFSMRRNSDEGVSACGTMITYTPSRDIHYSFTLRQK